jgi:hypothetical protein
MCAIAPLPHADVFGVCAAFHAENAVARPELTDAGTDRRDLPGELHSGDLAFRAQQAGERPREEGIGRADAAIGPRDRRRVHLHERLVVGRNRPLDVVEPEHLRRAVPLVDDRPHVTLRR